MNLRSCKSIYSCLNVILSERHSVTIPLVRRRGCAPNGELTALPSPHPARELGFRLCCFAPDDLPYHLVAGNDMAALTSWFCHWLRVRFAWFWLGTVFAARRVDVCDTEICQLRGTTPASVCDSGMSKVIGHCLNIRRMQCVMWCIAATLGLHVLRSSITGAPSAMLSLCCGSPGSVKELGYFVGKQHSSRYAGAGGIVVMSWQAPTVKLRFHWDQFTRNFLADLLATSPTSP